MERLEFIDELEKFATPLDITCVKSSAYFKATFSIWTGIILIVDFTEDNKTEFYFYVRTGSWAYIDERTDIHDIFSTLLSLWIRKMNNCSSMAYDVAHPVFSGSVEDDCEIYARYIVPTQTLNNHFRLDKDVLQFYKDVIGGIVMLEQYIWACFGGCPCEICKEKLSIKYSYRNELSDGLLEKINNSLGEGFKVNFKDRQLPTWQYYRDFIKGISVIKSKQILPLLRSISILEKNIKIESTNGLLLIQEDALYNFVSTGELEEMNEILSVLEADAKGDLLYVILDNKIVVMGYSTFIIKDSDSGSISFKAEKEVLKNRHDFEFNTLFKPSKIEWCDKISDSSFEDLIAELLRREPNVMRVRKVAHTNEPDGGKDLIIDIKIVPDSGRKLPENINPYALISVIVQCKAYKNGVSKADVSDIRDTVEDYGYEGFMLAVASYTRRSLTEHLDKLRNTMWVDWWTSTEIEERIRKHKDLQHMFPNVFSSKT